MQLLTKILANLLFKIGMSTLLIVLLGMIGIFVVICAIITLLFASVRYNETTNTYDVYYFGKKT